MGVLEEHHGGTHSLEGKHAEQFIIVPLGIDHEEVERLEALLIEERCDRGPVHQGFDDSILESRKLATELEDRLLVEGRRPKHPVGKQSVTMIDVEEGYLLTGLRDGGVDDVDPFVTAIFPVETCHGNGLGVDKNAAIVGELSGHGHRLEMAFEFERPDLQKPKHGSLARRLQTQGTDGIAGSADFGVCIHDGRFTWQQQGLTLVEDLEFRWEAETGGPLPLGGIVASRSLPADTIARVQRVIADSLRFAFANPAAPLPTMRDHAQELDDPVLMQHVDLYVNDQTLDLGPLGQRALDELSVRAAAVGLGSGGRLEIFPG